MKKLFGTLNKILITPISSGFIFRKRLPKHTDILLECHDADRGINYKDLAYAQILDSFQDDIKENGFKCFTLAKSGSSLVQKKAYGAVYSPISLMEGAMYLALALLDRSEITKSKSNSYLEKIYEKILLSSNCKAVIGIQPTRHLIAAGRKLHLPVIDLLHGYCVSSTHSHYGIRRLEQTQTKYLCTDYIALDQDTMRSLEKNFSLCNKKANCWSLLSPVLKTKPLVKNLSPITKKKFRKNFLISLQWGIDRFEKKFSHNDGELHPRIEEIVTNEGMKDFGFIIKPHPILVRNQKIMNVLSARYQKYKNIYIDDKSGLLELLQNVDAHITIFSSTVREAALLGVKSLIFSSDDHFFTGESYYFQPEIEHGIACRVNNWSMEQIFVWLKGTHKKYKIPTSYLEHVSPQYHSPSVLVRKILHSRNLQPH